MPESFINTNEERDEILRRICNWSVLSMESGDEWVKLYLHDGRCIKIYASESGMLEMSVTTP